MNEEETLTLTRTCTGDTTATVHSCKQLCRLWAGFGIVNEITTGTMQTFVVKKVVLPSDCTSIGDERKKQSYECEAHFYENGMASRLHEIGCIVPVPLHVQSGGSVTIAMTKLDGISASGGINFKQAVACMQWFARLHSEFWGNERADAAVALGIQQQGTYWYLDTRPDEFATMPSHGWEGRLKLAAAKIDECLKSDTCFQTICHGDAKSANMLFKKEEREEDEWTVQMYDFQYCGKASFGKDLAYFFICALSDSNEEEALMQVYYEVLQEELQRKWNEKCPELKELQDVVDLCVCDLGRWMSGWGWWGHDVSERIMRVLDRHSF